MKNKNAMQQFNHIIAQSDHSLEQFARETMRFALSAPEFTDYAIKTYARYTLLVNDNVAENEIQAAVNYLRQHDPFALNEINFIRREKALAEYK